MPSGAYRRVLGTLCALSLFACAAEDSLITPRPPEPPIMEPSPVPGPPRVSGDIVRTTIVREDFDSEFFVESSSVAIIDVNRGFVSLPVESFPETDSADFADFDMVMRVAGVVEAGSIVVQPGATIEAADAVELRAADELRVSGQIRAGPGGVTLIAGRALSIDGSIQSEGPIRLRVGSTDGSIEILGAVATIATHQRPSADISIVARGAVRIRGTVSTGEAELADTGDIDINTYGRIQVEGTDAEVRTGDSLLGHAGDITITTEQSLDLLYGGQLNGGDGNTMDDGNARIDPTGGTVKVSAGSMLIGFGGGIAAGRALAGTGGAIDITVEGMVTVEHVVSMVAGAGVTGGRLNLLANSLSIGDMSTLVGGTGEQSSGDAFFTTIANLTVSPGASIVGGGGCTEGGALLLRVGGKLTVDETSSLRGGRGGELVGDTCVGRFAGGSVQIFAREVAGPLDAVATPGAGGSSGLQQIVIEPTYEPKELPEVRIRTAGFVESKIIDRGEDAKDLVPRLIEARIETPPMTSAAIQLAGANEPHGPYSEWVSASATGTLAPLAGARYLRYRIQLEGRALDAPVVDGFQLDLAPR